MNETNTQTVELNLDTFKVTREGHLDAAYETKRLTMNTLRVAGFLGLQAVLLLDKAVLASRNT